MSRQLELRTTSPQETRRLAATIAGALRPGDIVALTGELGAGKTCFVQGAAAALGVKQRVTSPSFVLRRDYAGTMPIVHLDVYRLDTLREVAELDYEEVSSRIGVAFIEWGDAMSPLLPPNYLEVEFHAEWSPDAAPASPPDEPDDGSEPRRVFVRARGDDWARRLAALEADLQLWRADGQG